MALTVDQKRLKTTKFPPEFDQKVDIDKVEIDLMKKWIAGKITHILGDEDDVVIDTCYNLLEQTRFPNIKEIQIQLTGFLNKECAPFCKELWNLMLSAQESPRGVPKEMLEAKKLELQQEQVNKAAAESRRRQEQDQKDMVDSFRRSERSERGSRGDGGYRGGRGDHDRRERGDFGDRGRGRPFRGERSDRGRDFDRHPPRRDSPSPPPYALRSPLASRAVLTDTGIAGGLLHHAAEVIAMSQVIAVDVDATAAIATMTDPEIAAAPPRQVDQRRLDALVVPRLRTARGQELLFLVAPADLHLQAVRGLPFDARGTHPIDPGLRMGGGPADTRAGLDPNHALTIDRRAGSTLDLSPPSTSRAHHHPGRHPHPQHVVEDAILSRNRPQSLVNGLFPQAMSEVER
ncbi:hypothetical protein K505DRAFT_332857 [Melanomma pulvis-pyrius CBS 109.77]|uniref:PWI domain-containing protein n=1 Tax=Melanomma pulvis-pyrius CBS 109.77 TaxID=1314802 RepID=A0A6A6XRT6_9PLEO|nr:hypothetical protein K505DRAFT_332857 [Melanomma pulvis-pyrius CBS 109.77]